MAIDQKTNILLVFKLNFNIEYWLGSSFLNIYFNKIMHLNIKSNIKFVISEKIKKM